MGKTNFFLSFFVVCALSLFSVGLIGKAIAIEPVASDYYSHPPLMVGSTKPAILMVLSKDMDMYAPAYVAPADHDGDGRIDLGFNPGVEYHGIFDPYSCYTYNAVKSGDNTDSNILKAFDYTQTGDDPTKRAYFIRLGPSIEDKEDATGSYPDANRLPKEIRDGYSDSANARPGFPAPRSVTGICPSSYKSSGTGGTPDRYGKNMNTLKVHGSVRIWSGNWLNWFTSSRLDVVRQVLYGGKRVVDTPTSTFLAAEVIPENAGVWGYDDFTHYFWLDFNEGSPYYDTRKYTPINPDRFGGHYRRLHSYGRADNRFYIIDNIWFKRQKEDVTNHEGFRSFNAFFPPKYRHQYTPLDYILNSYADDNKVSSFEIVVEACRPLTKEEVYNYTGEIDYSLGLTGLKRPKKATDIPTEALLEKGDYCQRYGNNYKPIGLLQKYAEMDQALFGLLTGAFNNINRWDAGWLRHNVGSIKNQINPDGTYKGTVNDNIFLMLDSISQVTKPRLSPLNDKRDGVYTLYDKQRYGWRDPLESNFGNPLGEMLYQGLLYFAKNSNSSYTVYPDPALMEDTESINLPRLGSSGFDTWKSPLFANTGDCLRPVILLLSSTTTSHDGDMLPGSPHAARSGAGNVPSLSLNFPGDVFVNTQGLTKNFSMSAYLDVITKSEGLSGKSFYIANTNTTNTGAVTEGGTSRQYPHDSDTNLCIPRELNSLAEVRGLCPSAPQTYGTYAVAAAAYYGNTHDFDGSGNNVSTFAVALPTIFPKINLESRGQVISISPSAMSIAYPCGANDGDPRFCKNGNDPSGIQSIGPFTTNVIQWRADDEGRVYSGAVFAGFSGRLEGESDDYQLDAPVRYYFDLIRECRPGECDPDGNMAHKNSFRYESSDSLGAHSGHPSRDYERDIAYVFFNQEKYKNNPAHPYTVYNNIVSETRCNKTNRDKIAGCGSAAERQIAKKLLMNFKDGRYAAGPFKRHREWVYKNWDHAGMPNYIFSSERPKNYKIAAYMPKRWSQIPGSFLRPIGILTTEWDPDPTLMQSYSRRIYGDYGGQYSSASNSERQKIMRKLPGAQNFFDYSSNLITVINNIDFVPDESASLFIDRPYTDLGYEEVMDVYGYIGEPYKIYKKVASPDEIDEAIGVAVFMYSLYEEIDNSDRPLPINIGYYMHGGLNYAQSKEDNPSRSLGDGSGTYIEIQNEHNYMGGSPQKVLNEGLVSHMTTGEEKGLMTIAHPLNTPPTCYRAGTANTPVQNFITSEHNPALFKSSVAGQAKMPGFLTDYDATPHKIVTPACGSARLPLTNTRFFRFPTPGTAPEPPTYLPDPLWLAAKYGGFNDQNHNGYPETNEFDILPAPSGDGIPDNYFYAKNLSELKDKLAEAFEKIMNSVNVGTATSSSVNSVLGGGVTVRTYFQSSHTSQKYPENPEINWIGDSYALFVDLWGNMREDTNGNGKLDLECGFAGDPNSSHGPGSKGDWIVEFVDCSKLEGSYVTACSNVRDQAEIKSVARLYPDQDGNNLKDLSRQKFVSLENLNKVWDLGKNLADLSDDDVLKELNYGSTLTASGRQVFFHQKGVTSTNFPVTLSSANLFLPKHAGVLRPYLLQTDIPRAQALIEFILGKDAPGFRSRTSISPWNTNSTVTCRLGDIINSQPIIVGSPFSRYDSVYGDASYAAYRSRYALRRHLAVVGANDGMMHVINMGRPYSLKDGVNGYTDVSQSYIGKELWAFIPQSLIPHLQWLAQMDYGHSYYFDLTPTVVEVKDSSKSEGQGGPWRTIILGSLRFGGRAIEMASSPPQYSYSEVFAIDVTDPDNPPILLWRFTHPQLGLVQARPTVVRNNSSGDHWYVVVGSGPTYETYNSSGRIDSNLGRNAYEGYSNQSAKLFVFDALKGPGDDDANLTILDLKAPKTFISQFQVLMAPTSSVADQGGSLTWNNELAYLSVIQSAPDKNLLCLKSASEVDEFLDPNNPNDFCPNSGDKYSNYGYMDKGGIWRLRMNGAPSSWQNQLKVFYNAERPISGAVNTTYDATGRLWVFFGSGRYFSSADSHLCEGPGNTKECRLNHVNYLYGIREPVNGAGELTYQQVYETNLMDVSNIFVYPSGSIQSKTSDGSLGTFTVDSIEVKDYEHLSELIAQPSSDGYRRAMATGFGAFVDSTEVDNPYKPGSENTDWWKGMSSEMILEQVALVPHGLNGSAMAFSTFLPESATCGSVGRGITMMVDTFTGLPKPIFGSDRYIELNHFLVIGEQNGENENYVTGYVAPAAGKHTQTVVTVTGTNENRKIGFMTNHTGGSGDSLGFPDEDVPQGGVVSWREVLDFSNLEIEP